MRKFFLLALLACQACFANSFFNISATGTSLKIKTNIPNHVYPAIGIQINSPNYSLSNASSICKSQSHGFCILPMGDLTAQVASIEGPAGSVAMTLCLNGAAQLSCQKYNVSIKILHFTFITEPSSTTPMGTTNGIISPAVQVGVYDQNNNLYTASSVPVTLSVANQPNSGIYQGLIGGTTTVYSNNGIATFSNLAISQIGTGYTLLASTSGITSSNSSAFNITGSTAGYTSQADATEGFEITYTGNLGTSYQGIMPVYIDYGSNPIDSSEFASFNEPNYLKNSPRQPIFDYTNTLGSPNAEPGPLITSTIGGYTWGEIAQIQNFDWPFNPNNYPNPQPSSGWQAGASSPTVPTGVVKYSNINKNQPAIYTRLDSLNNPILRYFVTDPWGNVFMMDATNAANVTPEETTEAFEAAILPTGWSKSMSYLSQDLYVNPAYGATNNLTASILKFRDSADNSYVQLAWSSSGNSLAQQIGYPMPLWAGPGGTTVRPASSGNNIMYGSTGNDLFYAGNNNDTINGGHGNNGVFLSGSLTDYSYSKSGNTFYITKGSATKTLTNIQYLQFSDGTVVALG